MGKSPKSNQSKAKTDQPPMTIVGIGASAGGLAAIKSFFSHTPADSGLTYVVIVHLSPEYESHLADLLQPTVKMPVLQVTDSIELKTNHVYIIPPGYNLNSIDTHLRLSKLEDKRSERAPVNHFFRTLASAHDGHAVGVILTGTGSDGTNGLRDIKEKGGLTIVQDPEEAEFDGMPRSALNTGMVDLVLPVAEITQNILRIVHTKPLVVVPKEGEDLKKMDLATLQKIFAEVHLHTGRDYGHYKHATILRRIQRRMQLSHIEHLEDYLSLLRKKPKEVQDLSDEFLITVTRFFRDAKVFEQLAKEVIPQLFKQKGPGERVRVWSIGCATGEEAYSLAMLLLEETSRSAETRKNTHSPPELQIFASDLHEHSLQKARQAFYSHDIESDVGQERLRRFFVEEEGGYRIRKEVREIVVFTPHNLLSDPPFSRLDFIVCRNVMIYLKREVQRDLIELFHFALNADGFLSLGSSETIESAELFHMEDKQNCLYRRRNVLTPEPRLPVFPLTQARQLGVEPAIHREASPIAYGKLHQQLAAWNAPPSLLVNPDYKVVHLSEYVGGYLAFPGGEITTNIFKLVREEFRFELQSALLAVKEKGVPRQTKPIPLLTDEIPRWVVLSIYPAADKMHEGFSLVTFEERLPPVTSGRKDKAKSAARGKDDTVHRELQLQEELGLTRQRLQTIMEEHERSQETMRASNEELQSTNEELRSTMEELETSKEELQSMNEELTTLNQENKHKVEELTQVSGDLQNLLTATDIATIFLDRQLCILKFTPRVEDLFNVRSADRGRPLSDLTHRLGYQELLDDARQVLAKLTPVEREVQDQQHRWYLTRVLPYLSIDNRIDGVVITFVEITRQKQVEQEIRAARNYAEQIVNSVPQPLVVLTSDLKVQTANRTFYDTFKVKREDTTDQKLYDLGNRQWDIPELRKLLEEVLPKDNWIYKYEVSHNFNHIGKRTMLLTARRLEQTQLILLAVEDVTDLKQARELADQAGKAKEEFLAHMSHEIRTPLTSIVGLTALLLEQNPKPSQRENLSSLKFTAENLKVLVNNILDFSKIRSGKDKVEEKDVNLRDLINNLHNIYELRASQKGCTLQFYVDEQLPKYVRTDHLKLSQVLHNLLDNAIKFTEQGMVKFEVTLTQKTKQKIWVKFSVRDTGIGIAEDKLPRIFDAFNQVDNSSVKSYLGTGLGLSITKLLLETMSSGIEVETKLGEGSCFYFTLPMKRGSTPDSFAIKSLSREEQSKLKRMQLLLVDDQELNRELMVQFFRNWWQLAADEAADGQQAIEMARKKPYDLILMDVHMPVVDGYQAAKSIRNLSDPHYQQAPIIALTADTRYELKNNPKASLFTDVITKPFDPGELQQKIIFHALRNKIKNSPSGKAKNSATETPVPKKKPQGKRNKG